MSDKPITLYYAPATRANRVRWLLLELDVPFELVRVDRANPSPEFVALSPLRQVPVLRHGDVVMIESCAIVTYLADVFLDRGLAPPVGSPESAAYLQWLFYVPGTLEPLLMTLLRSKDDEVRATARAGLNHAFDVLSDALRDREYLVANRFGAADIAIGFCLLWARSLGALDGHPVLVEYGRRIGSRPAAKAARAD